MNNARKERKTRNWASIIYEDSAPENWRELVAEMHMPSLVSPLHDRDVAEDGHIKKPHRHIIIMADGPITQKRANELFAPLCGTQSSEYINSLKGYVRYLAHLDDPYKAQYDPREIETYGGADLAKLLTQSQSSQYEKLGEILDFCTENSVTEFCELLNYTRKERSEEWFPIVANNAFLLSRYLTSKRHSQSKQ